MGHSILVYEITLDKRKLFARIRNNDCLANFQLTFNWGKFANICIKCCKTYKVEFTRATSCGHCNAEFTKIWFTYSDLYGRNGTDCAQRIYIALGKLKNIGIEAKNVDLSLNVYYGNDMSPTNQLVCFAYQLEKVILPIALANPTHYFFSDNYLFSSDDDEPPCIYLGDTKLPLLKYTWSDNKEWWFPEVYAQSDDFTVHEPQSQSQPQPSLYAIHPIKGQFLVDSFKGCMELYGIFTIRDDKESADYWFKFGMDNFIPI